MTKQLTIKDTAKYLLEQDNFLILTHRRPDGDTLGSGAALCRALRNVGKTAFMLENAETTPRYSFLTAGLTVGDEFAPECIIAVDIATPELFPTNALKYAATASENSDDIVHLAVDHHPSNNGYAAATLCDPSRAACGELVYDLICELTTVDLDMATALYVAVSTDTGCFSYDNTTAETLAVSSKLVALGTPIAELNRTIFRAKSRGRIAVEGLVFTGMTFHFDDRAAIVVISGKMLAETGANEDDLDSIAALPASIEGVLVGITIRELVNSNDCKISVRSSEGVDANVVCARFGGGGHARAAGFTSPLSPEEIRTQLLPVLEELLP